MLPQNLLSSSFLKLSCSTELETMSMNFLYLVEIIHWYDSHFEYLMHAWLCNIMHCSLFHWIMQIFQMLTIFIITVASLNSPSISSEKILCIGKLSNWPWLMKVSQNSNFSSKAQVLPLAKIIVSCCCFEVTGLLCLCWRKCLTDIQIWLT